MTDPGKTLLEDQESRWSYSKTDANCQISHYKCWNTGGEGCRSCKQANQKNVDVVQLQEVRYKNDWTKIVKEAILHTNCFGAAIHPDTVKQG